MPKEFLYAPYRENRQCFTAYGIDDDYALWTFFFILRTWWARMRYRAERGASAT
jgi:hypothetical protein